jgi:superfamily II DNA or RNA helicase
MRLVFDRGTVVVEDPPGGLALREVSGFVWDPRIGAHRAPACHYAAIVADLVRRGVRFSDDVRRAGRLPGGVRPVELRPYQEAALDAWELGGRRGIVALPTGSGKTRVALCAIVRTGLSTLCLVPTRVLLEQWLGEVRRVYPGPVGCYGDGLHVLAPVTVATFESAWRHMGHLGNRFDLLVVDEAHHFGGGARDDALEMTTAAARLGLTATPPRDPAAAARLGELVGPVVYELAIADLAGTFLASFDVVTLHLDLDPDERCGYERDRAVFRAAFVAFARVRPGGSWDEFVRAAQTSAEGRRALAAWRRTRRLLAWTRAKSAALRELLARHRDSRILVFTAENESAYAIARAHLVMPLTCHIGRSERQDALGRFRRGELTTLVSARVLNEGLDVPAADVGVIVGASLGEREHVQRVGRLLRPAPGKRALVYELVSRRTAEVWQASRRRMSLAPRVTAQL